MKWVIPAKTFLVGEYVAMGGGPAILLTTFPCFELRVLSTPGCLGIHPDSPAGKFWAKNRHQQGLSWFDPYQGRGGMGASSAQFLGIYLAAARQQQTRLDAQVMLDTYLEVAWSGEGQAPSGYDVMAQAFYGCVFLHQACIQDVPYLWCFQDVAFVLVHTGQKLATHDYLKQAHLYPDTMNRLAHLVWSAREAFQQTNSAQLIEVVNAYYRELCRMNLVALHTLSVVEQLAQEEDVLAIKGCGAMGVDVLLLLVPSTRLTAVTNKLSIQGYHLLATSADLYQGPGLLNG